MWDRIETPDRDHRATDSSDHAETEIEGIKAILREAAQETLGGRVKYITYGGAAMLPRILRFLDVIWRSAHWFLWRPPPPPPPLNAWILRRPASHA